MSASTFAATSASSSISFSPLFDFAAAALRALFASNGQAQSTESEQEVAGWEQDYLDGAGDLYDLEDRQRALDNGSARPGWSIGLGC
ncbi:hypothetical protein ACLB1G_06775 [Oxalobacteraceae bacterium A2-2]